MELESDMELEAEKLDNGQWAVRPKGQLGTMGWFPQPWCVLYVKARSAEDAVRKVELKLGKSKTAVILTKTIN